MEDFARLGWVKLHRRLIDHPRFTDGDWLKVWTACLSLATHKPYRVIFEGKERTLQPGQFITSRKSLSEKTGVQESKVERLLFALKTEQQIEQLSTPRNRLISVKNWEKYQDREQLIDQQLNNNRTASEHKQEDQELRSSLPAGKTGKPEGSGQGQEGGSPPLNGGPEKNAPAAGASRQATANPKADPRKPRAPDPIWDTLCEVFGLNPVTAREQKRIGGVVRDLRLKEATPEMIRHAYSQAQEKGWSDLSPEGLVTRLDQLTQIKPRIQSTAAPVFIPGMR